MREVEKQLLQKLFKLDIEQMDKNSGFQDFSDNGLLYSLR